MILAIIFAQLWGVVQLIVLTSLSRTVRARTVLAAMAVGLYAIGPVTAFLQLSWIRIAAHLFGKAVLDLTGVASYTIDPFIEEAMKLLPLFLLMVIPAIRRQWSLTDCLLIAAATGSGFGLAEHLFRYADYASTAQSVSGGYAMTIGSATPLVPGILRSLTSWIPLGVFFEENAARVNWHLAWSAIAGLAVGLLLRNPKKWARPTAIGLLVLVSLDHAAGNAASARYTWLSPIAAPMRLMDSLLALLVLVAIVVAWWLDQPSQRAGMALGPLLAAEEAAPSRLAGTFTAALSRLPWSIPWVFGFDRARRTYHAVRGAAPGTVDDMHDAVVAERDSVDRKLTQREAPPLVPVAWMPANVRTTVRAALRRPPVIIWLVLIAPSVLYLIIGGFPALSGLQAVMKGPIVWPVVLLITLLGQGRRAWRVLVGIRMLPAAARHPIGDDAAMLALQVGSGLGTLSLAGFTFARVLSGVGAGERMISTAHAADAMNRTQPAGGAAVAGSGGAFDPPPAPGAAPGAGAGGDGGADGGTGAGDSGSGSSGAGPEDSTPSKPAPPAPPPSPQDRADEAAARAAQADADAAAAEQARSDAMRAQDAASIKQATAQPQVDADPDVAAAAQRAHDAQTASEAADAKNLDGDDPWDKSAPNRTAADEAHQAAKDAQSAADQARSDAENKFAEQQAADARAAKEAADNAQNDLDAARANAAAAHENAANAQANADAAARDAARAAHPAQAAADDAQTALADAKAKENAAFMGSDAKAYHDARAALDVAKAKADAAQAAADAAKNDGPGGSIAWHKKP